MENRKSKDDKMSEGMWEAVEIKARKVRMAETEGEREEGRGRKETKRKKKKEEERKEKKPKKIEVRKVAKEWEIWDEEKEAAKSEEEAKKLVPAKFHKWIYIFSKKASEWMFTRKLWDHAIDTKKGFVPRKGKMYPLSRKE